MKSTDGAAPARQHYTMVDDRASLCLESRAVSRAVFSFELYLISRALYEANDQAKTNQ